MVLRSRMSNNSANRYPLKWCYQGLMSLRFALLDVGSILGLDPPFGPKMAAVSRVLCIPVSFS